MASYLCKFPNICPNPVLSRDGPTMVRRTVEILKESQAIWPLSSRWLEGLQKFVSDKKNTIGHEGSMADGRDPIPSALHPSLAHSPVKPGPPKAPLDERRMMARRQSPGQALPLGSPNGTTPILRTPPPVPTPDLLIDPSIRLPAPQPPPQPPNGHMQMVGRNAAGSLDLLAEASFTAQTGVGLPPVAHVGGLQFDPSVHGDPEYCGAPPHMLVTNDGYENELQFYMNGGQAVEAAAFTYGPYSY